jgi:hypothetical protein
MYISDENLLFMLSTVISGSESEQAIKNFQSRNNLFDLDLDKLD